MVGRNPFSPISLSTSIFSLQYQYKISCLDVRIQELITHCNLTNIKNNSPKLKGKWTASSLLFSSRRSSSARKVGRGQKKREGEVRREREGKEETIDNPLLKNLRGLWRPQYSDWPVWAFPSTGLTTLWHLEFLNCNDDLQFRRTF